jgi:hypothetical protein
MARIPAVCKTCGTIFPSAFSLEGRVHLSGNLSGPCPRCGGVGAVLDGAYEIVGNAITLLSGPQWTVEHLRLLELRLRQAQATNADVEVVRGALTESAPELRSLADVLPKTRSELYAFISMLLVVIGLMISCYEKEKDPQIEIHQVINIVNAMGGSQRGAPASPPSAGKPGAHGGPAGRPTVPTSRAGRNDPCPCGSGLKFKKCHLRAFERGDSVP